MAKRHNKMRRALRRTSTTKTTIKVVIPIAKSSSLIHGVSKTRVTFRDKYNKFKSKPLINYEGLAKAKHYTSRRISLSVDSNGTDESSDPAQYVNRLENDPRYAFFDDIVDGFSVSLDTEVDDMADMLTSMIADGIMSDREYNDKSIHDRMDKKAIESGVKLLYSAKNHIAYEREPQVEQNWKRHYKQKDKVKTYGDYRVKGGTEFLGKARNLVESGDLYNALTVTVKRGDGKIVEVIK